MSGSLAASTALEAPHLLGLVAVTIRVGEPCGFPERVAGAMIRGR